MDYSDRLRTFAATLVATIVFVFSPSALAFIDAPVLVTPSPIQVGQTVQISITAGECDAITSDPVQVTRNGSTIVMTVPMIESFFSDFCIYPTGALTLDVGVFPPGSYTLQVNRSYFDERGLPTIALLGTLQFTVLASISAAPALGPAGLISLALLLFFATIIFRRGSVLILLALTVAPFAGRAQNISNAAYLEVMLSAKQGAPSPSAVVSYYSPTKAPVGPPPLPSLGNPQSVAYLLPRRATGDFLALINTYPNWVRSKLERFILVQYPSSTDLTNTVAALKADPNVESVHVPDASWQFSSASLVQFSVDSPDTPMSNGAQYGRDDLNADGAWQIAGGYALVGDVDSGLYTAHPALQQFSSSGQYVGGNFVPASSINIGFNGTSSAYTNWSDPNVDELFPLPADSTNVACNPNSLPAIPPSVAGHGTHVAGLVAANVLNNSFNLRGTCKHCGIAEVKMTYPVCLPVQRLVTQTYIASNFYNGIGILADSGVQVLNLSFGNTSTTYANGYCATSTGITDPACIAIAHAAYRDTTVVASAGNNRSSIQFPANDSRILDAGGVQQNLAIWDLYPTCPSNPPETNGNAQAECGSAYQYFTGYPPQEVMASANQVLSTTYPNLDWNTHISCGDHYPPGAGGGAGWCTGTSMSAPQISGIVGILRSINPLVYTGGPTSQPLGIRAVLASTTFEVQANSSYYNYMLGYGHPDAASAAMKLLGTVAGRKVLNRVTPLFRLYSSAAQDYADTTSPQLAIALMINQANNYQTQGSATPGYAHFPNTGPDGPALSTPLAKVYLLTTEYTPQSNYPPLVPLYQMQKTLSGGHIDFMLVNNASDIEAAHNAGYSLRTIQGYVYQSCTPEPSCIPPGAQTLYRKCNSAGDCATFLSSEAASFSTYTITYPTGSNPVLGYAYPNVDTDGDGLIDGMEYVIGTNPNSAHSDGNTSHQPDGVTYPQAGVPVGDPCLGSLAGSCPANSIFKNGFEP